MKKSELRAIIREEIKAITEGGRLRRKVISAKDAARILKLKKVIVGEDDMSGYNTPIEITKMAKVNTYRDLKQFYRYDEDGWLYDPHFAAGNHDLADFDLDAEFDEWCGNWNFTPGEYLVVGRDTSTGNTNVYIYGVGGVKVYNDSVL